MKKFNVTYDIKNHKRKMLAIIKSNDTLVIRMHQGKDFTLMMHNIIKDHTQYRMIFTLASADVYVISMQHDISKINALKNEIAAENDVRFVGYSFKTEKNNEPVIYTENIFIQFDDNLTENECEIIINNFSLIKKSKLTFITNGYFVATQTHTGDHLFNICEEILKRKDIQHCHPELIHHKEPKIIHPNQWHLKQTVVRVEIDVDASANVENAHKITRGQGTTIAVIDDGFDLTHPEFMRDGKIIHPANFSGANSNSDPSPSPTDTHGTPCAGVACADGRYGASGVAPEAKLMPIRLAEGLGSLGEALAFVWAADNGADIISCSWGPVEGIWFDPDDPEHEVTAELPALTRTAIDYAIRKGRQGKGCVIFFAAGNGNESVDNDGYASYEHVIAVAACNDRSMRSTYSDFGKALWCTFPSGDFANPQEHHPSPLTPGIWTTDGRREYSDNKKLSNTGDIFGNYINSFNGTSSACPGAAGVAALILSVNPLLTVQEVKDIIRYTCDQIDKKYGFYNKHGHSQWYGYGRINAGNAVQLARKWHENTNGARSSTKERQLLSE
ncbi:S8 family peptidase [Yersinia rohdei]|uniref:S8 family peptidase n=1 Tax=Yersinia rohdei TaxID=29485 RepID=UPI0011A084FC|nr:S8 family serine peptidase [Yersinia rohdei]